MRPLLLVLLFLLSMTGSPRNAINHSGLEMFSNNTVDYSCQDNSGAIWLHTDNSIFRFNGNETEEICSGVNEMTYGGGKHIFAFGGGGLLDINTETYLISPVSVPILEDRVQKPVLFAKGDSLYIGIGNKLFRSCKDGYGQFAELDEKEMIKSLNSSRNGFVLAGTGRGNVFRISGNGEPEKITHTPERIYSVFEDSYCRIWIGTGKGAVCLDGNHTFSNLGSPIRTFCEDFDGNIIGGSSYGLWSISKEGECQSILIDGNRNCPVEHVLCDRDGGIWIGTHYQGIMYLGRMGLNTNKIMSCNDHKIRQVRAITKDENGKIGIFTDSYGIYFLDPVTGKLAFDPRGLDIKFQCALYDKSESAYWCGEYKGSLIRIDSKNITRFPVKNAEGDIVPQSIYSIAEYRGELYVGSDVGMFIFNPKVEKYVSRRVPDFSHSIFSLFPDEEDKSLWVGSIGLYKYDFNTRELTCPFPQSSPLSKKRCGTINKDSDGSLLVGVLDNGLCNILDGKEEYFNRENSGLENNEVSFAYPINDSIILIGNRSGISFIDKKDHLTLNYSSHNMPTGLSMRMGASIIISKDLILAGGKEGIVLMDTENLPTNRSRIPFAIDKLIINSSVSQHISDGDRITLEHNQNNIKVGIANFDYARIRSCLFQCKLDGVDNDWIPFSGEDYVSYQNLQPGKYTMRIRCGGSIGDDFEEQSIKLHIKHVWYASNIAIACWILIAVLIMTSMLMLAYSRVMLRNKLQQEKKVMEERTKMFIDISHKLRTPLTMILGNLEMFFDNNIERIPGIKLLESSLKNAKNMKEIISEYVDIEDQAEVEHYSFDEYSEDESLGFHSYKMLIIDDNSDVRSLLKSNFASEYDIFEAENGRIGLNIARKEQPDIIISDVQMPEMNGIALCAELRKDFTTRQIPIILLTAHASEQHNLEGILMGADDYITKPFNAKLLKARCRKLIENRQLLRDRLLLEGDKEDEKTKLNDEDIRFLNAAIGAVERNLGAPDLNVVKICSELSVSRSTLVNYIRRLTGMTPGNFIEEIKLKKAAMMLKNSPLRINEISDELGFSNPQYFTIRFKKKYGCPPSEYK